jgi:serpin B
VRGQVVAEYVQSRNSFAFNLYKSVCAEVTGNVILAPVSLSDTLVMVHVGARGETASEIAEGVQLPFGAPRIYETAGALKRQLQATRASAGWSITTQSNVWLQERFEIADDFRQTLTRHFDVQIQQVDFSDTEMARAAINQRTRQQTEGEIEELFPSGSLDANARLVLTNALVFRGTWEHPFDPKHTRPLQFHIKPGESASVPMMITSDKFRFFEGDSFSVLELPYRGGQGVLLLVVPRQIDGLPQIEKQLSVSLIDRWREQLERQEVLVVLPRCKVASRLSLGRPLQELGMVVPFRHDADFSGIQASAPLRLSEVVQQVSLEIDESGTTAKGASGAVIEMRTLKAMFRADRPFLLMAIDGRTNAILLLGRIAVPVAKP